MLNKGVNNLKREGLVELLKKFEIFTYCSDKQLEEISCFLYGRTYRKGQQLFTVGDPRERIYLLVNGFVKFEKSNPSASLAYADYISPNTLFPYGGFFSDKEYQYTAIAITDVELYYIPTFYFEDMVKQNRKQLIFLVQKLSSLLHLHESRLQTITNSNAQDRVIHALSYLMTDLGVKEGEDVVVCCPMTTTEISKISGTSRETVSHVIQDLKKNNVLSFASKKITIHDEDYFNKVGGNYFS